MPERTVERRERQRGAMNAEAWAAVVMLAVSLGVAAPVLLGWTPVRVPWPVWVAGFTVFLGAILLSGVSARLAVRRAAYALALLAVWGLLLTSQGGYLSVLLVVAAALGVEVVPRWALVVVVALNTLAHGITTWISSGDSVETVVASGFTLLIQAASVLSTAALLQERSMRRELAAAHVALRAATLERTEAARTAERLRISRDLHDALGHRLTVLALQLETAKHSPPEAAHTNVERADAEARSLLAEVRSTVDRLRVPSGDLEQALRELTADLPGLEVEVDVEDVVIDDVERHALSSAAREIVTNAIRHAEAERLHLRVVADAQGIAIIGRDDGRGALHPRLGNGLTGLRERFTELGGNVDIDGRNGFTVEARLPR